MKSCWINQSYNLVFMFVVQLKQIRLPIYYVLLFFCLSFDSSWWVFQSNATIKKKKKTKGIEISLRKIRKKNFICGGIQRRGLLLVKYYFKDKSSFLSTFILTNPYSISCLFTGHQFHDPVSKAKYLFFDRSKQTPDGINCFEIHSLYSYSYICITKTNSD